MQNSSSQHNFRSFILFCLVIFLHIRAHIHTVKITMPRSGTGYHSKKIVASVCVVKPRLSLGCSGCSTDDQDEDVYEQMSNAEVAREKDDHRDSMESSVVFYTNPYLSIKRLKELEQQNMRRLELWKIINALPSINQWNISLQLGTSPWTQAELSIKAFIRGCNKWLRDHIHKRYDETFDLNDDVNWMEAQAESMSVKLGLQKWISYLEEDSLNVSIFPLVANLRRNLNQAFFRFLSHLDKLLADDKGLLGGWKPFCKVLNVFQLNYEGDDEIDPYQHLYRVELYFCFLSSEVVKKHIKKYLDRPPSPPSPLPFNPFDPLDTFDRIIQIDDDKDDVTEKNTDEKKKEEEEKEAASDVTEK